MSGRILIVDSASSERIVLKAWLAKQAFDVTQASDIEGMLEGVVQGRPDLLVLPNSLNGLDAVALFQRVRALPNVKRLPTILHLSGADLELRLRALKVGIDAVVEQRGGPTLLSARIRSLLRRTAGEHEWLRAASGFGVQEPAAAFAVPRTIALITPRLEQGLTWRHRLNKHLRDRILVMPDCAALHRLDGETTPDAVLVVVDSETPKTALQRISDLRSREETRDTAILALMPDPDARTAAMALDLGADDLIEAPFDSAEIALRLRREIKRKGQSAEAKAALEKEVRLASTDALTGLHNRRYAMAHLERMDKAVAKYGPYAVMLLDLDRFKSVNDTYGHAAGDAVLIEIAQRMRRCLRQEDLLARFGGEEFLIALPDATMAHAKKAANRIREAVAAAPIALPDGRTSIIVTASIGLALSRGKSPQHQKLLRSADRALYAAKAEGRNQVTIGSRAA